MLDRILNINPQDKYKNSLKIINHPYAVNRQDNEKQNSKDSALFSPLAKLLSKINWKILKIEYPSEDQILFNFLVDEFEFITIIDFNELYENPFQDIVILQAIENDKIELIKKNEIKIRKITITILNTHEIIKTDNLAHLFSRVKSQKHLNFRSKDAFFLKGIINGLEDEIFDELDYILKVVYTFIYTRFKTRIKNNYHLKTQKNIPIMMQKVAIIYAE